MASLMKLLRLKPQLTRLGRFWRSLGLTLAATLSLMAYGYGQGWPIPQWHCLFQATLGGPGPGCGLTRSWIALSQGQLSLSLQFHLLGLPLALMLVCVTVQAALELVLGVSFSHVTRLAHWDFMGWLWNDRQTIVMWSMVATLMYYGLRLYARYGSMPLALGLETHPLWQWLQVGAQQL